MTWHTRSGGTWRTLTAPAVKVAGTWRTIQQGWVKVSGTWRQFFSNLSVQLVSAGYSYAGTASMTFNTSGQFSATNGAAESNQYAWLLSGTSSQVDVRVTPTSGTFSTGTTGTWLNLGTSRAYTRTPPGLGANSVTATVELRNAVTLAVLDTKTISIIGTS